MVLSPHRRAAANKPTTPPRPVVTTTNQANGSSPQRTPAPGQQLVQRPSSSFNRQQQVAKPTLSAGTQPSWAGLEYLKIRVYGIPSAWGTWDTYQMLSSYGNLSRIKLLETRADESRADVWFKPPPSTEQWIHRGKTVRTPDGVHHNIRFTAEGPSRSENVRPGGNKGLPSDLISVPALQMDVGVMEQPTSMLGLFKALHGQPHPIKLSLSKQHHELKLTFASRRSTGHSEPVDYQYRIAIDLAQLRQIHRFQDEHDNTILTFSFDLPPQLWRKTNDIKSTHDAKVPEWKDSQMWFRQTGIDEHPSPSNAITQIEKEAVTLDIGQWLTYRLQIGKATASMTDFNAIGNLLYDHNVAVLHTPIAFHHGTIHDMRSWMGESQKGKGGTPKTNGLSALDELTAAPAAQLAFLVRYQLEVCMSQGLILGCNIIPDFLYDLLALQPDNAIKLLENVADDKKRYYNPMDIFRSQSMLTSSKQKDRSQCTKIPAATITPSMVYLATRVMETSNRVVRRYREHEDRFLRVKFTDERWKGKIYGSDDGVSELLTRVYRTMRNGIKIGDRFYEFLAFGNAQFREHGAYFFASTETLTAADIRSWMGNFSEIKEIAKYAARLGQSFSTTKAIPLVGSGIRAELIEEIEHDGHVFSDGVGKISPFLARVIADEHKYHHSADDFPSVFQLRLAGCKGVVAVDPSLKGMVIQYRKSQKKFDANDFSLGICRISKFASAQLNVQIIFVLEALGVEPWPFLVKMRQHVQLLEDAQTNDQVALQELYRKVDGNGTALVLADMIYDGFMSAKDPFMRSCLRLWRAWCIKYLKEKARIPIDDGAFVLGCIDETATLKGHYDGLHSAANPARDVANLPEIFIQIDDPGYPKGTGRYKVITGICMVARNPSLHAGDVRVVRAVDVESLHHLKNCVVFPQTGDRPLPSMCSGGDLDGDDYLVIWDPDILPPSDEWNHEAMDYQGPKARKVDGAVSVNDIVSFFVTHMKNDNLGKIATAHKYWADRKAEGVKSEECMALANLHSMAVDYAKTGVPAVFPAELRFTGDPPHWSEKRRCYRSHKIIGQLYDAVKLVDFHPEWETPFDTRILESYHPEEQLLQDILEIKQQYDSAVRRLMAQYGIRNEFEVWTTYVLKHNQDNDYKFAEDIGEKSDCLKQQFQEICYEKAGTTSQERDWSKMAPFIAAMYIATAKEVGDAVKANREAKLVGGQFKRTKMTSENMPFLSFPWIFPKELGLIAKKQRGLTKMPVYVNTPRKTPGKPKNDLLGPNFELDDLPEVAMGDDLGGRQLPFRSPSALPFIEGDEADANVSSQPSATDVSAQRSGASLAAETKSIETSGHQLDRKPSRLVGQHHSKMADNPNQGIQADSMSFSSKAQDHSILEDSKSHARNLSNVGENDVGEDDMGEGDSVGEEEVVIMSQPKQSALTALNKLVNFSTAE